MEINSNLKAEPLGGRMPPVRSSAAVSQANNALFDGAAKLEMGLKETPAVRPDVVARARELISDPSYPPQEMVRKISLLLAMHMEAMKK